VLAEEYWQAVLSDDPLLATHIGDRRYDAALPDITPQGRERFERKCSSILRRSEDIDQGSLSEADGMTLTALRTELSSQLDYFACRLWEWTVDPLNGPHVELQNVESYQPIRTLAEGKAMAMRWRAISKFMDDHIANLRQGAAEGKFAVRAGVEKVVDEVQDLLSRPESEWPFLKPLSVPHDDWTDSEKEEFREKLKTATKEAVGPAFARYRQFLETTILPRARQQEAPGIVHVPRGLEAYARLIRFHTSIDLTPEEFHATGLKEVARINREMEVLGEKVFGTGDRAEILRRLRTDPSLYFSSRDEVFEKAESALNKARAAIGNWFGRLPKTECEVVRMEEHEEKHSTIAYYRPPSADGSRPGRYYINTSAPETRPRYEAEALAYHESIPGHHLQIAIAQELEGVPEFRKQLGVTAFIEGWGLYSERLADEMGLYSSDLDRIGLLSYDSWRACRLVVDTGMHAMRWTRQQAIDYMLENSGLAKNNIVNEVDRYIVRPAQALAYKTGQLEMMRLRREAARRQGNRFDIRNFHDVMLSNGAIPLKALSQTIERRLD
jgi:uncharacterized protein (DUF885 family)